MENPKEKEKTMKLTNNFHGTEAQTRFSPDELDHIQNTHPANWTDAEKRLVRRLRNALCGSSACSCGGTFGERPAFSLNTE